MAILPQGTELASRHRNRWDCSRHHQGLIRHNLLCNPRNFQAFDVWAQTSESQSLG